MATTTTSTTTTTTTVVPWVDKWRPVSFDQVVGNTKSVQMLSEIVERNVAIPHLLLCGPPGCGKTTCVEILCSRMVRKNRQSRILRSSSFDDRGIDSIRTTFKNFARARVNTAEEEEEEEEEEGGVVLEKIVILDEADSISSGAFQALRGIMDGYCDTTRFIIVCNNSAKIIEPIQSRCAIVRFSKVDQASIRSRIATICDTDGIEYTADGLEAVACVADGDVRCAINTLGSTFSGFRRVTVDNVYRTSDTPRPAAIAAIIGLLRDEEMFVEACARLRALCDDGYCPSDVVSMFYKTLPSIDDMEDAQRLEIAKVVGLTQTKVLHGASTYLQLVKMLWGIAMTNK